MDWWEMDGMKRQKVRVETEETRAGFLAAVPEAADFVFRAEDLASATAAAMGRPKLAEPLRIAAFWASLGLFTSGQIYGMGLQELMEFEGNGDRPHLRPEVEESLKRHVLRAVRFIRGMSLPEDSSIALAVAQHHERLDGSGYPKGLRGSEISVEGRILGAVCYYIARGESKEVLETMKRDPRFDPDVVEAMEEAALAVLHRPEGPAP